MTDEYSNFITEVKNSSSMYSSRNSDMRNEERVVASSKENLAWFQTRKERWIKSPRPQLKPLTPRTDEADSSSTKLLSSTQSERALNEPTLHKSDSTATPTTTTTLIANGKPDPSSLTQPISTMSPQRTSGSSLSEFSSSKTLEAPGSKGIFDNVNLVASIVGDTTTSFNETKSTSQSQPLAFGNTTTLTQHSKLASSTLNHLQSTGKTMLKLQNEPSQLNCPTNLAPTSGDCASALFGATKAVTVATTTAPGSLLGGSNNASFGSSSSPSPFTFGASTLSNSTPSLTFGDLSRKLEEQATPLESSNADKSSNETVAFGLKLEQEKKVLLSDVRGDSSSVPTDDHTKDDHKSRLIAFYKKYNPEKLESVDSTLEKFKGKEEELFRKLEAKYLPTATSMFPLPSGEGPLCFLEFAISGDVVGKVTVKLFRDKVPLACDNFQALCNGSRGKGRMGKPLCYKHSKVHRVVPLFCVQMGDFTRGDGTGGESIYKPSTNGVSDSMGRFKDETFLQHSKRGLLSMANNGPNRNGSQFFFTLRPCPSLDGKHVVFGEVASGMEVIEKISQVKTSPNQRPEQPVEIMNCGEIKAGKEVPCEVILEKAPAPFAFGSTFGSGVGQSSSVGFGTLAASATSTSFGAFGASTSTGSTPFSFGSIASSLPTAVTNTSSEKDNATPFPSNSSPFGFGSLTKTKPFDDANRTNFDDPAKASFTAGSLLGDPGSKEGQGSVFSFGSDANHFAHNAAATPGFAFRTDLHEVSDSEDSSRRDDDDTDDDE